jgi:hypothetical protein
MISLRSDPPAASASPESLMTGMRDQHGRHTPQEDSAEPPQEGGAVR